MSKRRIRCILLRRNGDAKMDKSWFEHPFIAALHLAALTLQQLWRAIDKRRSFL